MKNKPILRYILIELMFLAIWILGAVLIIPLIYRFRIKIRFHKDKLFYRFLWFFLNDTKPRSEKDIDAGDYGRYAHNFWGFYKQCAIRNSHWNLKLTLKPKEWKPIKLIPKKGRISMLNYDTYGFYKTFFNLGDTRYFIRTKTKDIWWITGTRIFNYQFGISKDRYIFKIHSTNKKKYLKK